MADTNTSESSGTHTTTGATEETIVTLATARSFVFYIDTNALVNGDDFILRVKIKPGSGGTLRTFMESPLLNVQAEKIKAIPVLPVGGHTDGYRVTIQRISGTNRAFPYEVVSAGSA